MLTLYHNNQEHVLDTTEYYVRELASGMDEIIFDISIWDPNYALLQEEANIVDRGGQRYLVKQIDAGAVMAKIVCQLDLDEWRATLTVGYDSDTKTVAQQIDAVKPAGWTVVDLSGSSIGRTIRGDYTPLQVCEACRDLYKVYIRWDNKAKICTIYPQAMGSPVGSFATRELNLKEINYKGKSNNFATRLYAVGKDGLTFASINSGKPYVDNNTYSSRVICAYWQDDRYTDKQSLLDDAREKLAKLAVPERSYDCAIVDLQATNPLEYNNLDFSLFTAATLIDDSRNTAINYQVVERHVWPYHPDRNDVIFNSEPVKIQNSVIQIEDELTDPNSDFYQILLQRQSVITDWLTNADSHVYIVPDDGLTGIKEFLFVNGDQPIETATQVMRLNSAGLGFSKTGVNGPFTNAFVFDSTKGGHLIADFITAGTLTANLIKTGILTDEAGKFSLNMATGALSMADGSFSGSISGSTITGGTISGATITSQASSGGTTYTTTISGGKITSSYISADTIRVNSDYLKLNGSNAAIEIGGTNGIRRNTDSGYDTYAYWQGSTGYGIASILAYYTNNNKYGLKIGDYTHSGAYIDFNRANSAWSIKVVGPLTLDGDTSLSANKALTVNGILNIQSYVNVEGSPTKSDSYRIQVYDSFSGQYVQKTFTFKRGMLTAVT